MAEDPLAPARGCLFGLTLSAIFWAALAFLLLGCAAVVPDITYDHDCSDGQYVAEAVCDE